VAQVVHVRAVAAGIHSLAEAAVVSKGQMEAAVLVELAVEEAMRVARMGFAVPVVGLGERLAVVGSRLLRSLAVAGLERGKNGGCLLASRIGWSLAPGVRSFAVDLLLVLFLEVMCRGLMAVLASGFAVSVRSGEP